jgi:O-methyltransferase
VYNDIDTADLAFIRRFDGYTMTSIERRFHLLNAVRYLVRHQIPGAIVECGVWRGGSMMLAASTLLSLGVCDRELHLFDTYAGMPPPAALDVDFEGKRAGERMQADAETRSESLVWAIASLPEVTKNMVDTGYPASLVHYVEGRVEETLPKAAPERIALLRLDTDWYESTRHELIHLYPRLVRGGVLIIDDYGYWKGARKAVDEFLAVLPEPVLLHRIDDTGRAVVKP